MVNYFDVKSIETDELLALPRCQPENVPSKNIDKALSELDELVECWNNRLSIENMTFAKRYFKGEMEVGLVFEIPYAALVGNKFVAIFKRKFPIRSCGDVPRTGGQLINPVYDKFVSETKITMSGSNWNQQEVFISDVDLVETQEGIVPSLVRLEPLDQFDCRCAGSLDFGDSARVKVGLGRTYWERSVFCCSPAIITDQIVGQQIEGGAKVVDAISDDSAPLKRDGLAFAKAVNFVTGLRVYLHDDGMRLSALESNDSCVKVRKMLFGPVDLYPDSKQGVLHDKSPKKVAQHSQRQRPAIYRVSH
jgi:hypothetical protein